jgi:hypothetical protein
MVLLLMAPVIVGVAAAHRMLQLYAPSNLLIAQARVRPPVWRTVLVLAAVAVAALVLMHGLDVAVSAGAPAWINLIVLILAWDAIKFGVASALVAARCLLRPLRGHAQRGFRGGGQGAKLSRST